MNHTIRLLIKDTPAFHILSVDEVIGVGEGIVTIAADTIATTTNPGSISRTQSVSGSVAHQIKTVAEDTQNVIKARKYVTIVGTAIPVERHVTAVNDTHIVTDERRCVRHDETSDVINNSPMTQHFLIKEAHY